MGAAKFTFYLLLPMVALSIIFICRMDQGFFRINEFIVLLAVRGMFILNITIRICAFCIYTGQLIGTAKQVNQVGYDLVKALPYICVENMSEVGAINVLVINFLPLTRLSHTQHTHESH
jgi:hypothetical protein